MIVKELPVTNELGLHARVACRITRLAGKFESSVLLRKGERDFDLKGVTGVIASNVKFGDVATVIFEGSDEQQAAIEFEQLFAEKFGER